MKTHSKFAYILGSIIGNLLEFYDFTLYGIFAGVLSTLFFPHSNPQLALMAAFAVLAIGYFTRPLGGMLFGHIGDRWSRRKALIIALLLMGLVTTLIGVLPTYKTFGITATLLLVVLRMLQGLAAGGEFAGTAVFLTENAEKKHRALISSLTLLGAMFGVLTAVFVANLVSTMFTHQQILDGAWRFPFLLGVLLALLGAYLRVNLWRESPRQVVNVPLYTLLRQHFPDLLRASAYLSMPAVYTGITTVFLVPYLTHYYHFSLRAGVHVDLLVTVATIVTLPLAAYLSDRHNQYLRWLRFGMMAVALLSYPLFFFMSLGKAACVVGLLLFVVLSCFAMGPELVYVVGLFKREVRFSGVGLAHGLCFSIIAGTSPLVLNFLAHHFGPVSISWYMVVTALIAWLAVCFSRHSHL
jgi:MFS transporter, MHS family, proline/betaine transporter